MAITIIQLSDIHIAGENDPIFRKAESLAKAIASETDQSTAALILLLTGDAAQSGKTNEFDLAKSLVDRLSAHLTEHCISAKVATLAIPGNHDCDFSGDQSARDIILNTLTTTALPPESVSRAVLAPLSAFFKFAGDLTSDGTALDQSNPYFRAGEFHVNERLIRFYLLNSAWMSSRNEKPGNLTFPVEVVEVSPTEEPDFAVSVLHHPFNWFRQPEAMRPLRDTLEKISDLILTGHEHSPSSFQKRVAGDADHTYVEGGFLQDRKSPDTSSFNVIRLDFGANTWSVASYQWAREGYYQQSTTPHMRPIGTGGARSDRKFAFSAKFEKLLDDPGLPLGHSKTDTLRLQDFFTYPDLREHDVTAGTGIWKRVKADEVVATILSLPLISITGSEKSGKTSLAKTLVRDVHRAGKVPLLLNAEDIPNSTNSVQLRKVLSKNVKNQYHKAPADQYDQLDRSKKVLIIDDFHTGQAGRAARNAALEYVATQFGTVIVITADEFYLNEIHDAAQGSRPLALYKRYDICEFGHLRLQSLAQKWLQLGVAADERLDTRAEVDRICKQIVRALRTNAIPHHPWILIVLLRQIDATDEPAAKNGSYGHLYNAVITAALIGSRYNK